MHKYFEINEGSHHVRCKAYYRDRCSASRAVIFCTGFAGHRDNRAAEGFSEKLLSKYKDVLVVVFNWPAHGDDIKKKLVLADCDDYLGLVIREVKARFGARELYAYATSFGGYLVLKYISEHENPFEKIALRCPAVNMYDVLSQTIMRQDEYETLEKEHAVSVGFDRKILVDTDFLESLKENDIRTRDYLEYADRILMIHGEADEIVPFESGKAFSEDNVIDLIPVPKADHRFQNPAHMSLANKYVMEFFDEALYHC